MNGPQQPMETVYRAGTRKEGVEHALVLEAAGIKYELGRMADETTLVVAPTDASRARAELDAYAREREDRSTAPPTLEPQAGGWVGVSCYAAVLLLFVTLQRQEAFGLDWFAAGKTQAGLIRSGQWWRTVTALTLHADLAHLGANLLIGGLVGLFVGQLLGSGLARASILLAGAAGNLLNAWIRPATHSSVGASTTVFAALGLLAAYTWTRRRHAQGS